MIYDYPCPETRHRVRFAWARGLAFALGECHPDDARAICAAYLDECAAGMPGFDPWRDIRQDARFWADCAHPAELQHYACAALRRLQGVPMGLGTRKRVFVSIWRSFTDADRRAFLARLGTDGQFQGGRA